jgi:hypothetical protein
MFAITCWLFSLVNVFKTLEETSVATLGTANSLTRRGAFNIGGRKDNGLNGILVKHKTLVTIMVDGFITFWIRALEKSFTTLRIMC